MPKLRETPGGRIVGIVLLNCLSVVLLSVSFAPFDCWFLAYVAVVPWAMALSGAAGRKRAILCAAAAGLAFWAANLYWLWWVTMPGYVALVIYLSVYWLVAAVVVRLAAEQNRPMWVVLPMMWVALEFARAHVISGFPWFFLAHTQYSQAALIQVADLTGQYGVSFFVAMVNGALIDLLGWRLFAHRRKAVRIAPGLLSIAAVCAAMLIYGHWRLGQRTRRPGPTIGLVQRAVPVRLGARAPASEEVLARYITTSRGFLNAGCDLLAWAESALTRGSNPEVLTEDITSLPAGQVRWLAGRLLGPRTARAHTEANLRQFLEMWLRAGIVDVEGRHHASVLQQAERVGALSRELGCPILAGATTMHRNPDPIDESDRWIERNSALWFDGQWRASRQYSKMHLVPFSEYIPFKGTWLHRQLRSFVPEVMPQLEPGRDVVRFELASRDGRSKWRLVTPICYEGTFARVCRRLVAADGVKKADILVNLSNDGWFVWPWGRPRGSTEHAQHLAHYHFRAVENRVPVVRAVNTGISAVIDSNGRAVQVVSQAGSRTMVVGSLLAKVLVDDRTSMYSTAGDVFAAVVSGGAVGLVGLMIWLRRRKRQRCGDE